MAVSNWILYIGVFLCATGVGVVIGAIFIFYWGIKKLEEAKQGNSYTENNTENNFTANIDHYHADNDGKPGADENVSREYISKEALEEGR